MDIVVLGKRIARVSSGICGRICERVKTCRGELDDSHTRYQEVNGGNRVTLVFCTELNLTLLVARSHTCGNNFEHYRCCVQILTTFYINTMNIPSFLRQCPDFVQVL
jgi:hypothetical protein